MFGRLLTTVATFVVAIVVALAVPLSTLRVATVDKHCCCPDPAKCHCPDHSKDKSTDSSMRACHNTEQVTVAPQLPIFEPPVVAVADVIVPVTAPAIDATDEPHPAPLPQRPDAPS